MTSPHVVAVMIHVPSPSTGLTWYQKAFPTAERIAIDEHDIEVLRLGDLQIEVVKADEKVSAGASGTVVYWSVDSLAGALLHFQSLGAVLYRGPIDIDNGQSMCQVRDPWGNCIGLRGPAS